VEAIGYVIKEAFDSAHRKPSDVEGIAVSARYGLIGSLIVGVSAAKSLAYALKVPLVGHTTSRATSSPPSSATPRCRCLMSA